MKLAVVSFSAGFHAKNNVTPLFEDVGAYYAPWHQTQELEGADAIYCIGWYVSSMQALQQHMALLQRGVPVIVHWAGSDILCCQEFGKNIDLRKMWEALNADHVVNTAGRPALVTEVRELGIRDVRLCHIASRKIFTPEILPIKSGPTVDHLVTTYIPPGRTDFFNMPMIMEVCTRLKDIPFITYSFSSTETQERILPNLTDWGKLTDRTMEHLIYASTIHLRIVEHDGCSLSVIENAMAGRRIVTNMMYPHISVTPKTVDGIAEAIENIMELKEPDYKLSEFYRKEFGPEKQKEIILGLLKELATKGTSKPISSPILTALYLRENGEFING